MIPSSKSFLPLLAILTLLAGWLRPSTTAGAPYSDPISTVYLPIAAHIPHLEAMAAIPAGKFQMGCDVANDLCNWKQVPLHSIRLSAFEIDKYEVTNMQYQACVQAGACTPPHISHSITRTGYFTNTLYAAYPVIAVDWFQAAAYCAWDGKRLPTEAEWEKAARGNLDTRPYPWTGAPPSCELANFTHAGVACAGDTRPVGSYPEGASPYGVMDMAGNVWEWVADWYQEDYYATYPANGWPEDPLGPPDPSGLPPGNHRTLRGGSWDLNEQAMRVSRRQWSVPEGFDPSTGFRCARSLP